MIGDTDRHGRPTPLEDPLVVALDHEQAVDPARVGGKAAALARAVRLGLPVLPGVVVPVGRSSTPLDPSSPTIAAIRRALGAGPLIARSSSPMEDGADASMAGQFATVADIADDHELVGAIGAVAASGQAVARAAGLDRVPQVAVLVQPMVVASVGGVCFGIDPLTGRSDRKLAVVSDQGPGVVVDGSVEGVRHLLDERGRVLHRTGAGGPGSALDAARCRALAELVDRLGIEFGGPQDVEFLFDRHGTLHLLQSRPVTTEVRGAPTGPVYGTGPVAETFPDPLGPLEVDLWVPPLAEAMREALGLAALAPARTLRRRPVVIEVDGWVAVDLDLVDPDAPGRSWRPRLDLRPALRRTRAAWRVGRLRAALPALAADLVVRADDAMAEVGPLSALSDRQLVGLLQRCHEGLRALHAHEILTGLLAAGEPARLTGVSVALRALSAGRAEGLDDDEIIVRSPVVLALTGPRIGGVALPRHVSDVPDLPSEVTDRPSATLREALRLRVRWVHELTARAVRELGARLAERGDLPAPEAVAALRLDDLIGLVTGRPAPAASDAPPDHPRRPRTTHPPTRFRLDAAGRDVALDEPDRGSGTPAGPGVAQGPVTFAPDGARAGSVLVVRDLRPDLAPGLGRLAALVAESGSPLAHLAILAREAGIPCVVGFRGATTRFREGQQVTVDGSAGTVRPIEEAS